MLDDMVQGIGLDIVRGAVINLFAVPAADGLDMFIITDRFSTHSSQWHRSQNRRTRVRSLMSLNRSAVTSKASGAGIWSKSFSMAE